MPNYTALAHGEKFRILRNDIHGGLATGVTSVKDAESATRLAAALTTATSDLAQNLLGFILDQLDAHDLVYSDWYYTDKDPATEDWSALPASTRQVKVTHHVLNALDTYRATNALPPTMWFLHDLAQSLTGQPTSVIRAVRDEIAAVSSGYDGPQVIAAAYDRKWGDLQDTWLATAVLGTLTEAQLVALDHENLDSVDAGLLGIAEALKMADFSHAENVDMGGYLTVALNAAQYTAWRHHHAAADSNTG